MYKRQDYEGADFATNFDYDGQTTIISGTDFTESAANTFVLDAASTENVTVTPDNFSEYMYRTAGKYYAVKFAKDLVSNPAYRSYNYAESQMCIRDSRDILHEVEQEKVQYRQRQHRNAKDQVLGPRRVREPLSLVFFF